MPCRSLARPLAVAAVLAAVGPAAARTQDGNGNGDPDAPDHEDTWIDAGHSFLEEKLFAPAVAFDRFFSDETDLEAERSRSFLQWRNELRFDQMGRPGYATTVRANLRMPGLNAWLKRLRVVVEGQTREAISAMFPESTDTSGPVGAADAGLRLGIFDGLVSHGDLSAGFILQIPPGVFSQARVRWAFPVGDLFLTRIATAGFWRSDTRFGTSADLHLERTLAPGALVRLASHGQLTQRSSGVEWSSELATLVAFGPRFAAAVSAGLRGATEDPVAVERYRVATRLRHDFYRRWIFLELEPEVYWPWDPLAGRRTTYAVTLRLEVQFHGTEARTAPMRSMPLEPADPAPAEPEAPPLDLRRPPLWIPAGAPGGDAAMREGPVRSAP